MKVLRKIGDEPMWSGKKLLNWDADDLYHKDAMHEFAEDIIELTKLNYYLDRETLLKMYDQYMRYNPSKPMWQQLQQALHEKLKEKYDRI